MYNIKFSDYVRVFSHESKIQSYNDSSLILIMLMMEFRPVCLQIRIIQTNFNRVQKCDIIAFHWHGNWF